MSFWLVTDDFADLPLTYTQKQEKFISMPAHYVIDGVSHESAKKTEDVHAFYDKMRAGKAVTTTQVNVADFARVFRDILSRGEQALCLAFSSGLSGTYQAAVLAADMAREDYPDGKIIVVDTLCASLGEGLLVHYVLGMRARGESIESCAQWAATNRQNLIHWFTVDDLGTLRRGGRVSASAFIVGSMLKIKPIMHVNYEGKLIPREKVQGRKRAIRTLAEKVREFAVPCNEGLTVFISHGDCPEDAAELERLVRAQNPVKEIVTGFVGPTIGAHSGPGTMAIFFLGAGR